MTSMKYFVAAVCLVGFVVAETPSKDSDKIKEAEYVKECLSSTGATQEMYDKSKKGDFSEELKFKEFLLCKLKKVGALNDKGEYQLDFMKTKLTTKYGEKVANDIIKACTVKRQETPLETSYQLAKCCYSNTPKDKLVL